MTRADVLTRVVEVIGDADGVDMTDLDPLYEYVDPAVLETLWEHETAEWSFTFRYTDHQVTLTHDGQLFVDGVLRTQDLSPQ